MLEAKNLVVGVEKFRVSGISFSLCGGDILGLVGRSGEGKSILIKTLTGLRRPLSGKITVKSGDSETGMAEIAGYSPQDNALFPFLTVEENIATFAELHGVKRKELGEKTSILLKRLGLEKSRKKRIIELSGGMRKRADLAAALIQDPSIIIRFCPAVRVEPAYRPCAGRPDNHNIQPHTWGHAEAMHQVWACVRGEILRHGADT